MARRKKMTRPKPKQLQKIYKGLLSADIRERIPFLATALHWYDQAWLYISRRPQTVEQLKDYQTAQKYRQQALTAVDDDAGSVSEKKEFALRKAVEEFEKVCKKLKPPLVGKIYEKLDTQRTKLEKQKDQLSAKYSKIMELIALSLKPKNYKDMEVQLFVGQQEKPRQFTSDLRSIAYSKHAAKQLEQMLRRNGLLPMLRQEIEYISLVTSSHPDGKGGVVHDPAKRVNQVFEMMDNLLAYSASHVNRHTRRLVRQAGMRIPKVEGEKSEKPKSQNINGIRTRGEKVPGTWYTVGHAMAILYTALKSGDWLMKKELQKMIDAKLESRLRRLAREGEIAGKWTLHTEGERVRLELH